MWGGVVLCEKTIRISRSTTPPRNEQLIFKMEYLTKRNIIVLIGPLLFAILLLIETPSGISEEAFTAVACISWIIWWWVTESVPLAVTALLPLILFPLTGVMSLDQTAVPYSKQLLFLFIAGFILALALEKWNLHRRIALTIVSKIGTNQRQIVFGFILATWFLSMWMSNTAMTVMMLPIALSVVTQLEKISKTQAETSNFGKALILSIAYAASIGGMATLVGTPTNLIFVDAVEKNFQVDFAFDEWMLFGFPISLILMLVTWWHLTFNVYKLGKETVPGSKAIIENELKKLGKISTEEKMVFIIFGIVALGWMFRSYLIKPFFPLVKDTHIALMGAILLFLLPAPNHKNEQLMDWKTAVKLPWGVILLFGGAFAVAAGFQESGLTSWIGAQLQLLKGIHVLMIFFVVIAVVNFLTEITMNMATCTIMMPIMAALASVIGVHPFLIMAAVCIASSCAFMLPMATAPNALVFGSERLKIKDMARAGFSLNLISILVITLFAYFVMPHLWNL